MTGHIHNIAKEKMKYLAVGGTLLILTGVTVLANNLSVSIALGIAIALVIAIIKSSLVVSFFMHLIAEKKLIYMILILTVILFGSMMSLFLAGKYSVPEGTKFLETPTETTTVAHESEHAHTQGSHH